MIMPNSSLVTFLSSAFLCFCCGCGTTNPTSASSRTGTIDDASRLAIMAVVFRAMGESSGVPSCLLDVSDSDFHWLKREFSANPPKFEYNQAKQGDIERGYTILSVRILKREVDHATVSATYLSTGGFSRFRYELLLEGSAWKTSSIEFILAS